jgi:hypothetical protein
MNSEFENQLQRQPMREVPQHWRAKILSATQPQPARWREWFQPWPQAWKTLGAAWVVIFAFHFTTPSEPRQAGNPYPVAPQSFVILQERMMMAQLGSTDADEKPAALPAQPKPRSETRRRELAG